MNITMWSQLPVPSLSARVIAIIIAIAWLTIGVLEVFSPTGWDARLGIPLKGQDGLSFVQAIGGRNFAISLVIIFAAVSCMRAILSALFFAIAIIAAIDFYIVSSAVGAAHAIKHAFFVLLMSCIAAWVALS